jgi:hypothetical protein
MIIKLEGATAGNVDAAKQSLSTMAQNWGTEIAEVPAAAATAAGTSQDDRKVIDPVSLAALVLSFPSAVLAVQDLADRIRKRRRAKELIDQAQQLAAQQVTVSLTSQGRTVELRTLNPDQLLDLAGEDPAG